VIARKEVTNREWFEFVNDPETLAKIDAGKRRIILPREPSKLLVREREGSGFEWSRGGPDTPVYGVSWNDVQAYLAWRNARARSAGERFTYDLPTPKEWEKAARGADGRYFPWGSRFDPSLTTCARRKATYLLDAPGGFEPRDESQYGVLDMAGSRQEWTRDVVTTVSPPSYEVHGGSWAAEGDQQFRCAGHGYSNAEFADGLRGFRLVLRPRGDG
jgi:formylglycine-generating enzyme required for sulfatase activity